MPKPRPLLRVVTGSIVAALNTLWTKLQTMLTHSQKRRASASSPPTSSAPTRANDSRILIGYSWGDNRTLPISSEMERQHSEMSWMSCTDDGCGIYKNEKEGAGYWPKDLKIQKQSKKTKRKEQDRTSTSNVAREARPHSPISKSLREPPTLPHERYHPSCTACGLTSLQPPLLPRGL